MGGVELGVVGDGDWQREGERKGTDRNVHRHVQSEPRTDRGRVALQVYQPGVFLENLLALDGYARLAACPHLVLLGEVHLVDLVDLWELDLELLQKLAFFHIQQAGGTLRARPPAPGPPAPAGARPAPAPSPQPGAPA